MTSFRDYFYYLVYPVEGNDTHMDIQILCKNPKP